MCSAGQAALNRTAAWNISEDLAAALVDRAQPRRTEFKDEGVMVGTALHTTAAHDSRTPAGALLNHATPRLVHHQGRCYMAKDTRWLIVMMPFRHAFYW